jgi:hypothetical protein
MCTSIVHKYRNTGGVRGYIGTGVIQVYRVTGVVEEYWGTGVIQRYNVFRSSTRVQEYCRVLE